MLISFLTKTNFLIFLDKTFHSCCFERVKGEAKLVLMLLTFKISNALYFHVAACSAFFASVKN